MYNAPGPPESSLLAVRKVVPSREVHEFFTGLYVDAREVFGYSNTDAVTVTIPASLKEQTDPGYSPQYEDVGSLRAEVLPLQSLRVVLFARRAAASEQVNRLLQHAYSRLIAPEFYPGGSRKIGRGRKQSVGIPNQLPETLRQIQADRGFDNGRLPVVASSVANTAPWGSWEQTYSLKIDYETSAADVLVSQHEAIEYESKRVQATKSLRGDERFSTAANPLEILAVRVPGGLNRETERFEEIVDLHNPLRFELGPVEWRLHLVSPDE